jgi:hypothetical protein
MTKLWILRPHENVAPPRDGPWEPPWDKPHGFVIEAESPDHARRIADQHRLAACETCDANYDEMHPWLSSELTTCRELTLSGTAQVIMCDFHAG